MGTKVDFIREFWKQNKRGYFVSAIIVSMGALIIHARDNTLNLISFFTWLPITLLLMLMLVFGFGIFINIGNKE